MSEKDLEIIEDLILRYQKLPKVVELRIKSMTQSIDELEKDNLLNTYKGLDDLLNDTLVFINVKFPDRQDLMKSWNSIDFDPKLLGIKVNTNSQDLIRSNWLDGLNSLERLLMNLKREIVLRKESKIIIPSEESKKNWEWKTLLALASFVVAVIVMIFGNNLYEKYKLNRKSQVGKLELIGIPNNLDNFIDSFVLNSDNHQIIDKGLYIKEYFDEFVVGGANLDSIKINAVSENIEPMDFKINEKTKELSFSIFYEPKIEIKYKQKYYAIDVNYEENKETGRFEHMVILSEIKQNSLNLKPWK